MNQENNSDSLGLLILRYLDDKDGIENYIDFKDQLQYYLNSGISRNKMVITLSNLNKESLVEIGHSNYRNLLHKSAGAYTPISKIYISIRLTLKGKSLLNNNKSNKNNIINVIKSKGILIDNSINHSSSNKTQTIHNEKRSPTRTPSIKSTIIKIFIGVAILIIAGLITWLAKEFWDKIF